MSSIRRVISQGDHRVKFLRSVAGYDYVTLANMDTFLTTTPTQTIQSRDGINTVAVAASALPTITNVASTPAVFRDLGRRVTVVYPSSTAATTGLHRAIFIEVQAISGATEEGVPVDYPTTGSIWIPTWVNDPDSASPGTAYPLVRFIRTG